MQNVPTADLSSAAKVEFSSAAAMSEQGMSGDLFGEFMAHQADLEQEPFAPAPNVETMIVQARSAEVKATELKTRAETLETSVREKIKSESDGDAPQAQPGIEDMKEVKVQAEDFQAMKLQLEKYGLSKADIQELEERVNSSQGLTWGSLVQFIAVKMDAMNQQNLTFTAGQKQRLVHFFEKVGFSAPDSEKLVSKLETGQYDKVLSALQNKLQSLDQSKLAGLDVQEVKAFMQELRQLQAQASTKDLGMTRLIGQAMRKAQARVMSQAANQGQGDSQPRSQATDMANAARLNPAQNAEAQAQSAAENAERLVKTLSPEEQVKVVLDQVGDKAAESMQTTQDKPADHFLKQNQPKSEQDAWADLMSKLRQDTASSLNKAVKAETGGADSLTEGLATGLSQARENLNATLDKLEAPKVMRQVQDAVFKNLGQGQKRLTLQLEPAELGKLSIVLTSSSKGEVQATIRPDNHEVAKLIADNLEGVRQALEAEGLKVSKLEVQTQLPQFTGNEWQGETDHNLKREQQDLARQMGRWRSLRAEGAAPDSQTLESAVQALRGETGLHVIA